MIRTRLRGYFLGGLLIVLPVAVTFAVLRWMLVAFDTILQPFSRVLFGSRLPPVGVALIGLGLVIAVGAMVSNVIGRQLVASFNYLILRIPLARMIYGAASQLAGAVLTDKRVAFRRVVLVEWPRRGIYTLGFVTREHMDPTGRPVIHAFVGSTPNPTTGLLIIVPVSDTRPLDLTVEQGLTIVLSGGLAGNLVKVAQGLAAFRKDHEGDGTPG